MKGECDEQSHVEDQRGKERCANEDHAAENALAQLALAHSTRLFRSRASATDVDQGNRAPTHAHRVLFYGVVSAQIETVVEFFLEREAAEAMIGEVREDEPVLAEELRVEAIELG